MSGTAPLSLRIENGNLVLEAQPYTFVRLVAGAFALFGLVILSIDFFSVFHVLICLVTVGVSVALFSTLGACRRTTIDLSSRCISWSSKGVFGWKIVSSEPFGRNASAAVIASYNSDGHDFIHIKLLHDDGEAIDLLRFTDTGYRDLKHELVDRMNLVIGAQEGRPEQV